MDEFTANGIMKYNNLTILAAFMWVLTKVTGRNAAAGMAGMVASLDSKIKNLDKTIKEVKKKTAMANACAIWAKCVAGDTKNNLTKLYQIISTLKK